jgi:Putative NADPH-quinone reductase (modulator of drug activity B)
MPEFLIIYCHPWNKSFNHAVLEQVINNMKERNYDYHVIDLYAEKFNPMYDQEEMRLFHTGQTHDPKVEEYLNYLQHATHLIFITPVWWNDVPAMLKGFIDKVMKEGPGLSHIVTKTGIKGLLTNIESATVLTTSTSPTFYLKLFCGNSIQRVFVKTTMKQIGAHKKKWINFGGISNSKIQRRQKYLDSILLMSF